MLLIRRTSITMFPLCVGGRRNTVSRAQAQLSTTDRKQLLYTTLYPIGGEEDHERTLLYHSIDTNTTPRWR